MIKHKWNLIISLLVGLLFGYLGYYLGKNPPTVFCFDACSPPSLYGVELARFMSIFFSVGFILTLFILEIVRFFRIKRIKIENKIN